MHGRIHGAVTERTCCLCGGPIGDGEEFTTVDGLPAHETCEEESTDD